MSEWLKTAADAATVASAVAAAVGLFCVGWQIRDARRATDLQVLQTFMADVRDHERELAQAGPERIHDAFSEYLNLLEIYAAALNGKLAGGVAREIIAEKIKDAIVVFETSPQCHPLFSAAITSSKTFEHIGLFRRNNKGAIDDAVSAQKKLLGDS